MTVPEFWIVAGPNGAGKTTCVKSAPISSLLPNVQFLNPDERTLSKLQSLGYQGFVDSPANVQMRLFFESADEVFAELQKAIFQNTAIGVETVLSSDKYCALVATVREKQGFIGLLYIALASPSLAMQRVAARVQRGGHGIPESKIEQRWHRSLQNLSWFASQASAFWVIDNSNPNPEAARLIVASGKMGRLEDIQEAAFPELKAALSNLPH
jgi:predicted ABC-type ATPase